MTQAFGLKGFVRPCLNRVGLSLPTTIQRWIDILFVQIHDAYERINLDTQKKACFNNILWPNFVRKNKEITQMIETKYWQNLSFPTPKIV